MSAVDREVSPGLDRRDPGAAGNAGRTGRTGPAGRTPGPGTGQPAQRQQAAARSGRRSDRGGRDRAQELISLVTRLIVAQAGVAAAIGLSFSKRHIPSIIITLMIVAALLGLATMTRHGTHLAWVLAIGLETAFVGFGLFRFFTSRFLGGTLLAIITLGVLLRPAVSHAFSSQPDPASLGDNEALEGHVTG